MEPENKDNLLEGRKKANMKTKLNPIILLLMLIVVVTGCGEDPNKNTRSAEGISREDIMDDLQIIDISQKQLALYNQHVNTDSSTRVRIFRDSLYYPYQEVWDGYLGSIETFDAVCEHYGIRIIEKLSEKNYLFYTDNNDEALLEAFFEVRDGMIKLTGHSAKGRWYLLYGPSVANLGGVGNDVMFIDFGFPENKDLASVIDWFPHELNHQIYGNLNQDSINNALEVCINEGFAVYVNKLYWNNIGGKPDYTIAMSLSYTEEELLAAEEEWDFILNYFKTNYLSEDQSVRNMFGSRNARLKEDLPGAIGYLIGHRIIERYVNNNSPDSWKDVYTLNREELLKRSGFLD